jgi:hypothetical protein
MSAALAVAGLLLWTSGSPQPPVGQTPQRSGASAAWTLSPPPAPLPLDALIVEASQRFGVPVAWIRAVIRAESGFDPRAVSSAGAMGLMQLMPDTYADMRARHGLGPDPFAPRDNLLAGSAYLRHLHDRFGSSGVLAAYNAGPGRYLEHLQTGRPLPAETVAYEGRVRRFLASSRPAADPPSGEPAAPATAPVDPYASPLFVVRPMRVQPGVEVPVAGPVPAKSDPGSASRGGRQR